MSEPPIVAASVVDAAMLAIIHGTAFCADAAWGPDAIALTLGMPGVFGFYRPGAGMILARAAGGEAEVLTLAVAPASRGLGCGAALLAAAMAEAARRGAGEMFLEVAVSNGRARRLYQRAGFAETGRRRGYYADGADALILCASLSPCAGARGAIGGGAARVR